jgi:hypothetical protein
MDPNTHLFEFQVDHRAQSLLRESSKWAKFLSVVGFIFCVILVLIGVFFGSIISFMGQQYNTTPSPLPPAMMGIMMAIIYILIAIIYFFPCLYLFKFSTRMQVALRNNDQNQLTSSLASLKSYFKYLGILTIIALSFYLLAIVFVIMGNMMSDRFVS